MNLADWSDLFVAAAGASAALAGLIIVAMSVNIEVIVRYPTLPSRAGSTIAVLVLSTIASLLGLIPELPSQYLGAAIILFSLVCLVFAIGSTVGLVRTSPLSGILKGAVLIVPVLGFVIGGAILVAGVLAGLYVVVAGMLLGFVGTVLNAWVLLVEVRR
ncbi:hypothetical protein [Schumannella luteola]